MKDQRKFIHFHWKANVLYRYKFIFEDQCENKFYSIYYKERSKSFLQSIDWCTVRIVYINLSRPIIDPLKGKPVRQCVCMNNQNKLKITVLKTLFSPCALNTMKGLFYFFINEHHLKQRQVSLTCCCKFDMLLWLCIAVQCVILKQYS